MERGAMVAALRKSVTFSKVLSDELQAIELRQALMAAETTHGNTPGPSTQSETKESGSRANESLEEVLKRARKMNMVGLAFSGGGIRSATFCLGILQKLAGLGLLKKFDYLSTVSGGGYIGSWLTAWIKRKGIQSVECQLSGHGVDQEQGGRPNRAAMEEEPEPIVHLRSYSNYLTPRLGIGSLDGWTLIATYARNFILNQFILLPIILIALLIPRLLLLLTRPVWGEMASFVVSVGLTRFFGNANRNLSAAIAVVAVPPFILLSFVLCVFLGVGIMGYRHLSEMQRELWATRCGKLLMWAAIWGGIGSIALFSAPFLHWVGHVVQGILATGWVVTSIAGIYAGRSPKTSGRRKSLPLEIFARVAPYAFLIGLLVVMSWGLSVCLAGITTNTWRWLLCSIAGCLLVSLIFAEFLGVNTFSLWKMYQNRLVRCYLGASRPEARRTPNPITGFDDADDLRLWELRSDMVSKEDRYGGPYLLANTAMNLVRADNLAWQERKAEAFMFSPLYYGSNCTGYVDTTVDKHDTNDTSFSLGNVMAISGAAVSPNMGYHSSAAVTALLTFFNFRLGAWVQNPKYVGKWGYQQSWNTLWAFLCEIFGLTNSNSNYVYLSDGGHFENLGVYELVRRQCRYIIAIDAGQDDQCAFEDLGSMIRKCRTDFGVEIEINLTPFRLQAKNGRPQRHYAIGRIHYPQGEPGILVYIKSTLTGNEPADVLAYATAHADFPHEPTVDQFFSESQFESYRALGHHVAHEVFDEAVESVDDSNRHDLAALCRYLAGTLVSTPAPTTIT
jgi:hypothetical protein